MYADRRKLVNFNVGQLTGVIDESKVLKTDWCYIGLGGFEMPDSVKSQLLKHLSMMLGAEWFWDWAVDNNNRSSGFKELRADAHELFITLRSIIIDAAYDDFLLVTKNNIITLINENEVVFLRKHCMAAVGSNYIAAQILLQNDVAVKDIYKIISSRRGPVGIDVETFDINDLKYDRPPVFDGEFIANVLYNIFESQSKEKVKAAFNNEKLIKVITFIEHVYATHNRKKGVDVERLIKQATGYDEFDYKNVPSLTNRLAKNYFGDKK